MGAGSGEFESRRTDDAVHLRCRALRETLLLTLGALPTASSWDSGGVLGSAKLELVNL